MAYDPSVRRRELRADPEYRKKENARERERRADPEYREKRAVHSRERRAGPEQREKENAHLRERYATDDNGNDRQTQNIGKRGTPATGNVAIHMSPYAVPPNCNAYRLG